jgi:hypothetical protein
MFAVAGDVRAPGVVFAVLAAVLFVTGNGAGTAFMSALLGGVGHGVDLLELVFTFNRFYIQPVDPTYSLH